MKRIITFLDSYIVQRLETDLFEKYNFLDGQIFSFNSKLEDLQQLIHEGKCHWLNIDVIQKTLWIIAVEQLCDS